MKSILFVAVMALAIASCDTPQTTTGTDTDTTTSSSANRLIPLRTNQILLDNSRPVSVIVFKIQKLLKGAFFFC